MQSIYNALPVKLRIDVWTCINGLINMGNGWVTNLRNIYSDMMTQYVNAEDIVSMNTNNNNQLI